MKRDRRTYWTVSRRRIERFESDPMGLLDLLRYDRAVAEEITSGDYVLFSTDIERGPNLDRLRSYLVTPLAVGRDRGKVIEDTRLALRVQAYQHEQREAARGAKEEGGRP